MASKIQTPYYVLLFAVVFLPTIYARYGYIPKYYDDCWDLYINSSSVTVVGFDKIEKALIESGREIMSTLLRMNLHEVRPYCDDFVFFVDRRNRLTIYGDENNNYTVTLFVPRDEAMRIEDGIGLDNQIVMSRVDKKSFATGLITQGSELTGVFGDVLCSPSCKPVVTKASVNGSDVVISGAKITHWDIYNDGHVIVHGTDDFFNLGRVGTGWFLKEYLYGYSNNKVNTDEFEVA